MAIVLLKLVFSLVGMLSDLVTRVIFAAAAHMLVQMSQLIKVAGENSLRLLEQVGDLIRTCLEYLINLVIQALGAIVSSLFDAMKEGMLNTSSGVVTAVTELVEKSRTSLQEAVEQIPEVVNAFAEMAGKVVTDVLKNCNEAIAYVFENVLN